MLKSPTTPPSTPPGATPPPNTQAPPPAAPRAEPAPLAVAVPALAAFWQQATSATADLRAHRPETRAQSAWD